MSRRHTGKGFWSAMSFRPINELQKYGWEHGSGLGKKEQGMKEAIKVKLKFDSTGVGHDPGEQFTHHWWEKAFNDAANNIKVVENEVGISIEKQGNCNITTKKVDKSHKKNAMLYGSFVKAATLSDGKEFVDKTENTLTDSDSEDDDNENAGKSKISQLSDEEIFRICGGRTAHKGARHGLKLNGKLARIAQQEELVNNISSEAISYPEEQKKLDKKSKKKRKSLKLKEQKTSQEKDILATETLETDLTTTVTNGKTKKSKKRKSGVPAQENNIESSDCVIRQNTESVLIEPKKKKKKKKKSKDAE